MRLRDVIESGRALAAIAQRDIDCCGNRPEHPDDCEDCRAPREALARWNRLEAALLVDVNEMLDLILEEERT